MKLDLDGKVAVVTGAGGAICGAIAMGLAGENAIVAALGISRRAEERTVEEIHRAGGQAFSIECDVTSRDKVEAAVQTVLDRHSRIDILINGAGGSQRDSTTSPDLPFFDVEAEALIGTFRLNYLSAVIPCQVVGRVFAKQRSGVILNISSVAGFCPLTRALGYSSAKAALNSFTQWLAIHMADNYAPEIRVNSIAPGFMVTDQNRFLLVDEQTGEPSDRAREILRSTPMKRYGNPEELVGAAVWLVSDRASFVTGAVIPLDGGFSAFSGV